MKELSNIPSTTQYMECESAMKLLTGGNYLQPAKINIFPFVDKETNYLEDCEKELLRIFPLVFTMIEKIKSTNYNFIISSIIL